MKRFKLVATLVVAVAATAAGFAFAGPARAGGDYSGAQFQIAFSLNCNNPSAPCQQFFGLGGIWGWIALMPGGTGNAQVTDCGHSVGPGGGGAGAQHSSFDPSWQEFSSPSAPTPITPTDPNGNHLGISNSLGLPPFPATTASPSWAQRGKSRSRLDG